MPKTFFIRNERLNLFLKKGDVGGLSNIRESHHIRGVVSEPDVMFLSEASMIYLLLCIEYSATVRPTREVYERLANEYQLAGINFNSNWLRMRVDDISVYEIDKSVYYSSRNFTHSQVPPIRKVNATDMLEKVHEDRGDFIVFEAVFVLYHPEFDQYVDCILAGDHVQINPEYLAFLTDEVPETMYGTSREDMEFFWKERADIIEEYIDDYEDIIIVEVSAIPSIHRKLQPYEMVKGYAPPVSGACITPTIAPVSYSGSTADTSGNLVYFNSII